MTMRRSRVQSNKLFQSLKRNRNRRSRLQQQADSRRLHLEKLEDRRLLAVGPRLAGIQPNNSDLFSFTDQQANVRDVAPRELTLRFDENQRIDASTLDGIHLTRRGADGLFGTGDDVRILPGFTGFIGVGQSPKQNEVVIRFAESLPDDVYRVEVFGAGSASPLANDLGDLFVPTLNDNDQNATKDTIQFELDLGPQVAAVVPQPVQRTGGQLVQLRDQIEVYFQDDDLFVANDSQGRPTQESAENPDFYQLIFTRSTVRNTDDVVLKPVQVSYDPAKDLATLKFSKDLDQLVHPETGEVLGPGTFRLRVGSDEAAPLSPPLFSPALQVSSDFNTNDEVLLQFFAVHPGERDLPVIVSRHDLGAQADGAPRLRVSVLGESVLIDLNSHAGEETTAREVVDAVNSHAAARALVSVAITTGNPNTRVGDRQINYSPLQLTGLGSSFDTATSLTDDIDEGPVVVVTGSGNAFVDGAFFKITDAAGGVLRKFEFDKDSPPALNDLSSIPIAITDNMSQAEMTSVITQTINAAGFGVRAVQAGNRIRLEGDRFVDLGSGVSGLAKEYQSEFDSGQVLEAVRGGGFFADGQTFQVTPLQGGAGHV